MEKEDLKDYVAVDVVVNPDEAVVINHPTGIVAEEYDDDEYEESNIVTGQYTAPQTKAGTFNTLSQEVVEDSPLTPWDVIVDMAKVMNIPINQPKKGCKKCYGRGWTGRDVKTKHPVPCNCIFTTRTPAEKSQDEVSGQRMSLANMNRKQRRYLEKANRNMIRRVAKNTETIDGASDE